MAGLVLLTIPHVNDGLINFSLSSHWFSSIFLCILDFFFSQGISAVVNYEDVDRFMLNTMTCLICLVMFLKMVAMVASEAEVFFLFFLCE